MRKAFQGREVQLRCGECEREFGPITPHVVFDHSDHWVCVFCGMVRAWGGTHTTCSGVCGGAVRGTLDKRRRAAAIIKALEGGGR